MLRKTARQLKSQSDNDLRRGRVSQYKYREVNRWQREAMGINKWTSSHSHRPRPHKDRFNPESVGLTKGTSSFAYKWWYTQQPFLPNVAPADYQAPKPMGKRPEAWDDEFAATLSSTSPKELQQFILNELTDLIFEESQRDGYELRRLDFEGKPLTDLPEPEIIQNFVFEEETIRERMIRRLIEGTFRLAPTSEERKELRTVENITNYIVGQVIAAQPVPNHRVPLEVRQILKRYPVQPRLGFVHALPSDTRSSVLIEWERMHHLDWQFGKAVYEPTDRESVQGNLTWLREENEWKRREAFEQDLASGALEAAHRQLVLEAASSS